MSAHACVLRRSINVTACPTIPYDLHIARPPAPVKTAQHSACPKPVQVANAVPVTHGNRTGGFALSTDSGAPSTDSGVPPTDSGAPPTDSGAPSTDSGVPSTDSGTPPTDSGAHPTDSGAPLVRSLANLELLPPLARVDTALGELETAFIRVFRLLERMAESAFNDLMRHAGRARVPTHYFYAHSPIALIFKLMRFGEGVMVA